MTGSILDTCLLGKATAQRQHKHINFCSSHDIGVSGPCTSCEPIGEFHLAIQMKLFLRNSLAKTLPTCGLLSQCAAGTGQGVA